MFCPSCGAQIDDNSRFCKLCGYAISTEDGKQKSRNDTLGELDRMIQYFDKKQKLYDEYDECCEKIVHYSDPKTRVVTSGGTGKGMTITGIVFFFIGCVFSGLFSSCGYKSTIFQFWVLVLLFGLVLILIGSLRKSHYWRNEEKKKASILSKSKNRFASLENELSQYYKAYGDCSTASSYTNPKILKYLRKLVELGRADNIKEAINLMHQESHNSEMEFQAIMAARTASGMARDTDTVTFYTAADFLLN